MIFLLGIFLIVTSLSGKPATSPGNTSTSTPQNTSNLPDYILSSDEEASLKEFVKNFVNLYNTYSYEDYSNLTALGDYQTQGMQEKTLAVIENLKQTLPIGYSLQTQADENTFSYKYPSANEIIVQVTAQAREVLSEGKLAQKYKINATLQISRQQKSWLVDDIKINQ